MKAFGLGLLILLRASSEAVGAVGPWNGTQVLGQVLSLSPQRVQEFPWRLAINANYAQTTWLTEEDWSIERPETGCTPRVVACHVAAFNVKEKVGRGWQHVQQALLPCWTLFRRVPHVATRVLCVNETVLALTHSFTLHMLKLMNVSGGDARTCARQPGDCVVRVAHIRPLPMREDTRFFMNGFSNHEIKWISSMEDAKELQNAAGLLRPHSHHFATLGVLDRDRYNWGLNATTFVRELNGADLNVLDTETGNHRTHHVKVNLAFFEKAPPEKQASWVHAHDIIISPHGAQLSNLIFARPCTVVVEIFPQQLYIPGFYGMLALQVGALYYTATDPGNDLDGSHDPKVLNRKSPIHLDPHLMASIIPQLIAHRHACLRRTSAFQERLL